MRIVGRHVRVLRSMGSRQVACVQCDLEECVCKYINMNVCRQCRRDFLKGQRAKLCVIFNYGRFWNRIVFFFFTAEVKDADELASILHDVRP